MPKQVTVFLNGTDVEGLKKGQPSLFWWPGMTLIEEPTMFLHEWYVQSGRRQSFLTWETAAYALQSWLDFLNETGVDDWRNATINDLRSYRDAYQVSVSPKTGLVYAPGTIANRLSTILIFYQYAAARHWYNGDILAGGDHGQFTVIEAPQLAGGRPHKDRKLSSVATSLIPKRRQKRTAIRPFTIPELRLFLNEMGPTAREVCKSHSRLCRDRLIADFGWAVGLRNDEIHQLTKYQILSLLPDSSAPAAEQQMTVIGKFSKSRPVAVPNWLVMDALEYIRGERTAAVTKGQRTGRKESPQLFLSDVNSNAPGRPITHRRFQQIVEEACLRAGLTETIERKDPTTGAVSKDRKAKHCVHDLRHTYAVLTYWSEKKKGNGDPMKRIQAQLGHERLETTTNTYLSYVNIFDGSEQINDIRKMIGV